jgi:hypothetical protein
MFRYLRVNILVVALVLALLALSTVEAWNSNDPWDEEWRPIAGKPTTGTSAEMIGAIRNATKSNVYAASMLREDLEANYERTGNVTVRFSASELFTIGVQAGGVLMFLLVPVSIDYVRHGRFRIWNPPQVGKALSKNSGDA